MLYGDMRWRTTGVSVIDNNGMCCIVAIWIQLEGMGERRDGGCCTMGWDGMWCNEN